jgi:sugar/nucleoside kinase (ribokinase family)
LKRVSPWRKSPADTGTGPPEFVAVGHVTHDLVDGRIRHGGAALYSALTAARLGKRAALFTSCGEDFTGTEILDGIATRVMRAGRTSTFRNIYSEEGRVQAVYSMADSLEVRDFPEGWKASEIVYLCPVLHEVSLEMGAVVPDALLGVAPQGWMRTWDSEGRIRARRWEGFGNFLRSARFLIASEKDIEGNEDLVDLFRTLTPLVVITRADRGSVVFLPGKTIQVGAYPAEEADPTGAGDCFGAAFLIRYRETGDVLEAARFASCVGSFVVEGEGVERIPVREDVIRRMEKYTIPCREEPDRRDRDVWNA